MTKNTLDRRLFNGDVGVTVRGADGMVVLPNDAAHPLLNRQIVYTGLTRAKKRAVLVATEASLVAVLSKRLERNTGVISVNCVIM